MTVISHVAEHPRTGMPTKVRGLQLRGRGEQHIHPLRQLLFIHLDPCLRHPRLVLDSINAVINRCLKAIEVEIKRGEWVVCPEDRPLKPHPTRCQEQTGSEQTTIDLKTDPGMASRQDRW